MVAAPPRCVPSFLRSEKNFGSSTIDSYIYNICANYTAAVQEKPITLIGNPYMFTARRYDLETGLYYYRARYYNPDIGRFLQVDPMYQGMNWYAYCGNNSLNCTDPMGLYTTEIPLETIWHEPTLKESDTVTLENTSIVQAFLNDAHFADIYLDIHLIKATYNLETKKFLCDFEVPDSYQAFRMNIEYKSGIPILTVSHGERPNSVVNRILDWRLIGMLNDPSCWKVNRSRVGLFWGGFFAGGLGEFIGGYRLVKAVKAGENFFGACKAGGFLFFGSAVLNVWSAYKIFINPSKNVPNFNKIDGYAESLDKYMNFCDTDLDAIMKQYKEYKKRYGIK